MKRFVIEYTDYGFLNMDGEGVHNTEIIEARNILEASKKFFQHHDDDCYIESVFEDEKDRVRATGVKAVDKYTRRHTDYYEAGEHQKECESIENDETPETKLCWRCKRAIDDHNGPQEYNKLFADENLICDWCEDEILEGDDYYTFK